MRWTLAAIVFFGLAVSMGRAQKTADCLACHSQSDLQNASGHSVYVDESKRQASVHGTLECADCHTDIKEYPHPDHPATVQCGSCHSDEAKQIAASVHSAASPLPCLGCHGDPHSIVPVKDSQSPVFQLNIPRTCGSCHGDPKLAQRFGLPNVYPLYMDSVHGFALTKDGLLVAASCSSCHGSHNILAHKDPHSRTNRVNVPATCGACHAGLQAKYLAGIHGKQLQAGNVKAPVCVDCHTAHQIAQVQSVSWQMQRPATCGSCHKKQFATYRDTFHAQVSALGFAETARCWNCHHEHDIQPASDPGSPIAHSNLIETCSQCHKKANSKFVTYQPHADPHDRKNYPALYFASKFMNLLLFGVLGFFSLHTVLWFVRSFFDRLNHGQQEQAPSKEDKA